MSETSEEFCPRDGMREYPLTWKAGRWVKSREEAERRHDEEDAYWLKKAVEGGYADRHTAAMRGESNDLWLSDLPIPRTCDYCGGIHPEDAIRLVEGGWYIEATGKSYKRYLQPPDYLEYAAKLNGPRPIDFNVLPRVWHPVPPVKLYVYHLSESDCAKLNACLKVQEEKMRDLETAANR